MNVITKEQKQLVTLYAVGVQLWGDTMDIPKDSSIIKRIAINFSCGVMKIILEDSLKRLEDGLTADDWRELLSDIKNKAS